MGKRKTNLDDEIYLLTYGIPHYKDELSESIYGVKGHPTIINKVKKLQEKDWVRICKYEDLPDQFKKFAFKEGEDKNDKRHTLRDYVLANPKILLERLCNRLKNNDCELTSAEKSELKKYLNSNKFRMDLQGIVECCQSENNNAGGNIHDVFYSLLNFIIIESVFIYRYYELMDELYSDINLVESGKILEEIEKKFDKFGNHYFFPMSPSLAKKLYKLDVHTSNKLHVNYVIYGDRIFDQLDVMSKLLAEKRDNGDTQVDLQHILDANEKCMARKVNNIKKVVKDEENDG